jgi:2-succinyl-5-enolpyruvyl-6-hydroxy-3-cyclohexene-1-carboxylate synthase
VRQHEHVLMLAHALQWPVFADPRSGCRVPDRAVIAHFDALVRVGVGIPDVVLRLGSAPASKAFAEWLVDASADEILIDRDGRWLDPDHRAALVVEADPSIACAELAPLLEHDPPPDSAWLATWSDAERAAADAIDHMLSGEYERSEPGVARAVVRALPDDGALVVSSSMPIRDVEWYSEPRELCRVFANRGANGIDGVVSTAVGVALTGSPVVALVGDLAFLHDTNALLGAVHRELDLTVVVVDNDGGGIFSFLAQASLVEPARYEQLFGTPHGLDLGVIAAAYGARVHRVERGTPVDDLVAKCAGTAGVDVVIAPTERVANVEAHDALHAAVAEALSAD